MKIYLTLMLSVFMSVCMGQAITNMPFNAPAIGSQASYDVFSYQQKTVAHYGIGWYHDSQFEGGPWGYVAGYGGLKFFTSGRSAVTISHTGFLGLGTSSPIDMLDVNDGKAIVRNSIENGSVYLSGGINGTPCLQSANYINNSPRVLAINPFGGNVGIGTHNPQSKLTVAGNIAAQEVRVYVDAGADFVFLDHYRLMPIGEVRSYIRENGHLPEIPSAEMMKSDGISLGEMNIKLLQKIEELTLYVIEQSERLDRQQKEIDKLKKIN